MSLYDAPADSPETAAIYYEKQRTEEDPFAEVEAKEWFEHYIGLAEGVLLDNDDELQGERDLQVFELWINGYSPLEIAQRPEIAWLNSRDSVDAALRRIIHKLWEFFGVNPEEHEMKVGDYTSMPDRKGTGEAPKQRFRRWYDDPENRARHQAKCRGRRRQKRAAERLAQEGAGEQAEEGR